LKAVIVANGLLEQNISLLPGDLLIAADGGTHHCLEQGLIPSIVIGDLDSLNTDDIEKLKKSGTEIIEYPTRKDFTDLELALQYALELEIDEILILAALGARWDQTIANILLPTALGNKKIRLMDGNQEFFFLNGQGKLEIYGKSGDTLSLIPLAREACGITTENLEYPLKEEDLHFGSTRGISNVMLSEHASITLTKGILLCILIHESNNL
jgi:thiamine pyrophosphokinase